MHLLHRMRAELRLPSPTGLPVRSTRKCRVRLQLGDRLDTGRSQCLLATDKDAGNRTECSLWSGPQVVHR